MTSDIAPFIFGLIVGAMFGTILSASVQRHVTARKRDELGFLTAKTITHDPCELYASWTDVPAIDIEPGRAG